MYVKIKDFSNIIKREIEDALKNNYEVLHSRIIKLYEEEREEGEFEACVRGKISALRGILDFIEEQEMFIKED